MVQKCPGFFHKHTPYTPIIHPATLSTHAWREKNLHRPVSWCIVLPAEGSRVAYGSERRSPFSAKTIRICNAWAISGEVLEIALFLW